MSTAKINYFLRILPTQNDGPKIKFTNSSERAKTAFPGYFTVLAHDEHLLGLSQKEETRQARAKPSYAILLSSLE